MNSIAGLISAHRKANKWTLAELTERLNAKGVDIKYKAVSAWETGVSYPSVPVFFILCEIFEIKDIYAELWGTNPFDPMHSLNAAGREKVMDYIAFLMKDPEYTMDISSEPDSMSPAARDVIPLYDMPVSAGTGNFLEDSEYTCIPRDNTVPSCATFGVRISGDSMLPRFRDGQVVYVHAQNTLENGEIGIFLLNGSAYCKKFRNTNKGTSLISINKKYAPMAVNDPEAFRIFGKVLS